VRALARAGHCDVIIVGRGGGSLEDLWEFNNEALARTIFTSPVPIVSAVGHETDFTICDFVADLRAPTPSAAAEIVSAGYAGLHDRVSNLSRRLERDINDRMRDARQRLRGCLSSWGLREPERLLKEAMQRTDDAVRRMEQSLERRVTDARGRVLAARGALAGHDPGLILKKGYAIVRDVKNARLVTDAGKMKAGRHLRTELATGTFRSVVVEEGEDLFEG
jgi:exodeoxyribonuclease VII large subunit